MNLARMGLVLSAAKEFLAETESEWQRKGVGYESSFLNGCKQQHAVERSLINGQESGVRLQGKRKRVTMEKSTITFNRQSIRLCKGIIKAWEQWMDDVEYSQIEKNHDGKLKGFEKDNNQPRSMTVDS